MKKLSYPLVLSLTAFLIFYGCSTEEDDSDLVKTSRPAQDDSCLQQPRLDGAKSDQLFFLTQLVVIPAHKAFQQVKPRALPMLAFSLKTIKK